MATTVCEIKKFTDEYVFKLLDNEFVMQHNKFSVEEVQYNVFKFKIFDEVSLYYIETLSLQKSVTDELKSNPTYILIVRGMREKWENGDCFARDRKQNLTILLTVGEYHFLKQWIFDTGNEAVITKLLEEPTPFGENISSLAEYNARVNAEIVRQVTECVERLKPFKAIIAEKKNLYTQQPGECHCLDCLIKGPDADIVQWARGIKVQAQQALHYGTQILDQCPANVKGFLQAATSLHVMLDKMHVAFFNCKVKHRKHNFFYERHRESSPLPELPNWHRGMPEGK